MSEPLSSADRELLEELFERAADLPPAEHAAFAERECGSNVALKNELLALLAGLGGKDILGQLQAETPSRAGTKIGKYRLLERVGVGGMGEVYAAKQLEPVERTVALKIIKPGMDSAQIVARFHAEHQTLALMKHAHIAQVFDGGVTEDGRPYFVMEFVDGVPITEYCDANRLSTRERIELFLGVCAGVQHAHQKGVIHRDLKPSNLLVIQEDGRAVPKIIDFGIARATSGNLADRTLQTMVGQIVGTLAYMSPEQADPSGVDIDTRSDVYSLGVVLYELLSGLLPFDQPTEANFAWSAMQRATRDEAPPTPSTRLRRQSGTTAALAPLRGTDERALLRQLSGDLDWICLKALENDLARRYASASELAADLQRHLAHEPVLAARPRASYLARKFVRRHRVGVSAGLLVAAAVIAGIFGILSGRLEAKASARVADALRPQAEAYRLRQLEREADLLWPAYPHMIPALEAWRVSAQELVTRLPAVTADRDAVRARVNPWTEVERDQDRARYPRAELLAGHQAEYATWSRNVAGDGLQGQALEDARERMLQLEPKIAAMEAEAAVRRTWSFDLEQDEAAHDVLSSLVERLESLRDKLLNAKAVSPEHGWSVTMRLEFARKLEAGFAPGGEYARIWNEDLPRIRGAYPELADLEPQMGLLPLGIDPDSGLWEFAHLQSGEPAVRAEDGTLQCQNETGLVFVLLPGGTFWMGAQGLDPLGQNYDEYSRQGSREGPPIEVEVPPFFMSKFEMTQAQWTLAVGTNPSLFQKWMVRPEPRNPVNQVNWPECVETTGQLGLVLPTEEQWEYAARAGTTTTWWIGDDVDAVRVAANCNGQADGHQAITTVGSYGANAFGLHDVTGNAQEWCANHPYELGTTPGTGPETLRMRMTRGGSSRFPPRMARSASRVPFRPGMDEPSLGLRPVRAIDL